MVGGRGVATSASLGVLHQNVLKASLCPAAPTLQYQSIGAVSEQSVHTHTYECTAFIYIF